MQTPQAEPKTYAEFEAFKKHLLGTGFKTAGVHAHSFGFQRAEYQIEKLKELIRVGTGIEGKTIASRIKVWRSQVARLETNRIRFLELLKT